MREIGLGEKILQLVASPTDSASIVGDIREMADKRGESWFVIAVARTWFTLLWKDLTVEPWFMVKLAFRGLLIFYLLMMACILPLGMGLGFAGFFARTQSAWLGWIATIGAGGIAQYGVGFFLATRSRSREMAALVAYYGFSIAFTRLTGLITGPNSLPNHDLTWPVAIMPVILNLALVAAVVRFRVRSLWVA